jgi:transposase-like protein
LGKRHRRKFTDEFKADTVKLIRESGRTAGSVARELDLTSVLANLNREVNKRHDNSDSADELPDRSDCLPVHLLCFARRPTVWRSAAWPTAVARPERQSQLPNITKRLQELRVAMPAAMPRYTAERIGGSG